MAWRIETDSQPGYLLLRLFGDADARVSGDIVAAVFREITAHPCTRLLVDIRGIEGRLDVLETFHMVSNFPIVIDVRAAIVDRPEHSSWYEFYETVSTNRGYHNKVFNDMEKAVEWLMG